MAHLLVAAAAAAATVGTPPHIVLMVLDDVGWSDVGYHGSDFPTPNLDQLAVKEGVRLERYYVQQVCSPTRSAFMSGRYPFHTGMQHKTTLHAGTLAKLPLDATTIAEGLAKVGYRTHAIGKWHLGLASWDYTPLGRGFETWAGYLNGQGDHYTHTNANLGLPDPDMKKGFDFWRNKTAAWDLVGRYSTDFYMEEARRVIDVHDPTEPLFLYFAHQEQHVPLQGPPEAQYSTNCAAVKTSDPDGKNRHTLCTMMSRLDTAVGDFVTMMKDGGLWENTVMWVTTDNGGMCQFGPTAIEASAASNYPLRGGKATLFEGGVRAVSFVTGGALPPGAGGAVRRGLMHHVDVPVTLAALAGAALGSDVDGVDAWPLITTGEASGRTEVPVNIDTSSGVNFTALIQGEWKLIEGVGTYDGWWSNDPYTHTKPTAAQKAVKVGGSNVWLFNLTADESERSNVAAAHPDVVASMQRRITELADPADGYVDPQPNKQDPRADPSLHNGTWAPFL